MKTPTHVISSYSDNVTWNSSSINSSFIPHPSDDSNGIFSRSKKSYPFEDDQLSENRIILKDTDLILTLHKPKPRRRKSSLSFWSKSTNFIPKNVKRSASILLVKRNSTFSGFSYQDSESIIKSDFRCSTRNGIAQNTDLLFDQGHQVSKHCTCSSYARKNLNGIISEFDWRTNLESKLVSNNCHFKNEKIDEYPSWLNTSYTPIEPPPEFSAETSNSSAKFPAETSNSSVKLSAETSFSSVKFPSAIKSLRKKACEYLYCNLVYIF